MKMRVTTFEAELSTNTSLNERLAIQALDAFDSGDHETFRYASEIHDETKSRIHEIERARAATLKAFETARDYPGEETFRRAIGTTALAAMVLDRELRIA